MPFQVFCPSAWHSGKYLAVNNERNWPEENKLQQQKCPDTDEWDDAAFILSQNTIREGQVKQ